MNKLTLNLKDPQLLRDAVSLLKSQFTELYVGLGYGKEELNNAWHSLRTSKAGQELRSELYKGALHLQATTFISDMDQEQKDRLRARLKKAKPETTKQEEVAAQVTDAPLIEEEIIVVPAETVVVTDATLKNEIDVSTKKKSSSKPKVAEKAKAPKKETAKKEKPVKKAKAEGLQRGELKQKVQVEIDKGIVDVAKIMETTGASKIYINYLLKQNKKK